MNEESLYYRCERFQWSVLISFQMLDKSALLLITKEQICLAFIRPRFDYILHYLCSYIKRNIKIPLNFLSKELLY